jgi:hydrogenase-4 component B
VPLFNGFASKWSIYVATIQGSSSAAYLAFCAVVAIFTSALTLASFIKFFGVSFLSRTSATVAERAARGRLEVGWLMQIPQVFLAVLCVLLGLAPGLALDVVYAALHNSRQGFGALLAYTSPLESGASLGLETTRGTGLLAPLALALLVGLMFLLARFLARLGGAQRQAAAPWLCGYATQAEVHRYSAHHFYGEIKRYFHWLGGAPRPSAPEPADSLKHPPGHEPAAAAGSSGQGS